MQHFRRTCLNAELGGYLLTPLLEAQQNTAYTSSISYAAPNLGMSPPLAHFSRLDSHYSQPISESSGGSVTSQFWY